MGFKSRKDDYTAQAYLKSVPIPAVPMSPNGMMTDQEAQRAAREEVDRLSIRSKALDGAWAQAMELAEGFIVRPEQDRLSSYYLEPLNENQAYTSTMRLFALIRLAFDPKEGLSDKLLNVYAAMHSIDATVFTIIHGEKTGQAQFYIGCRSNRDILLAGDMLRGALEGNIPGIVIQELTEQDKNDVLDALLPLQYDRLHLCSLSVSTGDRKKKRENVNATSNAQSFEKFTELMKGQAYTAVFLAEPVSYRDSDARKQACEDVMTAISKYARTTLSYNENNSVSVNESISHGMSSTVSESYSRSTSRGTSSSIGRSDNSSFSSSSSVSGQNWLGQNASSSVSSGYSSGTSMSTGSSTSHTTGFSVSQSEGKSVNVSVGVSSSHSQGTGISVNVENRRITDLTAKLEYEIKKLSSGASYGLWDTAVYVLSREESSARMGVNGIRALLLGDESEKGESHINHWGNTQNVFESSAFSRESLKAPVKELMYFLHHGIHPVFKRSLVPGMPPQSDRKSYMFDPKSPLYDPRYIPGEPEYDSRIDPYSGGYRLEDDPSSALYDVYTHPDSGYYSDGLYDPLSRNYNSSLQKPLDPTKHYFTPTVSIGGADLPIFLGLPEKSIPGVTVVEMAKFGRNVLTDDPGQPGLRRIRLGEVMFMGKRDHTPVELYVNSLTGHAFVCGAPGSGKSNTIYQMLYGLSRLSPSSQWDYDDRGNAYGSVNFLVIEPAKGEYKYAFGAMPGIRIYTSKDNEASMLRINPFEFPYEHMGIMEHIERIKNIVTACWALTAAMPAILANALETAYLHVGWDLQNSMYIGPGSVTFPSFHTVLEVLPGIIEASGYSGETKGDYIGALVTRVQSLTKGIAGSIFTDAGVIPDEDLFDANTIIDLSNVGSTESRALIMGVIVMKLENYRKATATMANYPLRHVTVLEEAHNLLPRVNTSQSNETANVQGKSVEMITAAIAEMRTYGEGFIIVDQSPHQVAEVAISNTSTKVIMRLPGEDDVKAAGASIGLKEDQKRQITMLPQGQAIVKQGNWVSAVTCIIDHAPDTYPVDSLPRFSYEELKSFRTYLLDACLEIYERHKSARTIPLFDRRRVVGMIERETAVASHRKDYFKSKWVQFCELDAEERSSKLCHLVMDIISFHDGLLICAPEHDGDIRSLESIDVDQVQEWLSKIEMTLRKSYLTVRETDDELIRTVMMYILFYCVDISGPTLAHYLFALKVFE